MVAVRSRGVIDIPGARRPLSGAAWAAAAASLEAKRSSSGGLLALIRDGEVLGRLRAPGASSRSRAARSRAASVGGAAARSRAASVASVAGAAGTAGAA
eukprot:scaffold89169_cov60-Phaeocystis_antarctica.AAC.3